MRQTSSIANLPGFEPGNHVPAVTPLMATAAKTAFKNLILTAATAATSASERWKYFFVQI